MKTFLLWVLFAALIWLSNAATIKTSIPKQSTKTEANSAVETSTNKKYAIAPKKRGKRYAYKMPWRKDELTYSILKYTRDLPARVQEKVFEKAFNLWHNAAPQLKFKFKRNDPKADIKISFVKGAHGDAQAFDGSGPLIGHVYSPEDGRIHFDDDEWFTDKSRYGTNLLSSAVHEVGHALGMSHSKKKTSMMYKLYRKYKGKDAELDSDDIEGIQKLYRIRPGDRGNANCKDKNRRLCVSYKEAGYCAPEYAPLMKEYCKFTCGLCDS